MERLKLEDLARLVDEQPTPREKALLEKDPALRRELEAVQAQTRALRNLPSILPPPGGWHRLEEELVATGIVRGPVPGMGMWRKWAQIAAAFVLFIGGTTVGWITAGGRPSQQASTVAATTTPATLDDARKAVEDAEHAWRQAHRDHQELFHALNGQRLRTDPVSRLAALEALVAAGEAAVQESPADEFMNAVYVSTLLERQQVIHQISLDSWR